MFAAPGESCCVSVLVAVSLTCALLLQFLCFVDSVFCALFIFLLQAVYICQVFSLHFGIALSPLHSPVCLSRVTLIPLPSSPVAFPLCCRLLPELALCFHWASCFLATLCSAGWSCFSLCPPWIVSQILPLLTFLSGPLICSSRDHISCWVFSPFSLPLFYLRCNNLTPCLFSLTFPP